MIRISQNIDETLSIYRENKVIVWGCGMFGKYIYALLQYFSIEIEAFCDNNESLWGTVEVKSGVPIISPIQLEEMARTDDHVVVQIGCDVQGNSLEQQIHTLIGEGKCISLQEARCMLGLLRLEPIYQTLCRELISKELVVKDVYVDRIRNIYNYLYEELNSSALVVCSPTKTGNFVLGNTLKEAGVNYGHTWHVSKFVQLILANEQYNAVKVITAIREPIAQNLSMFYQHLGNIDILRVYMMGIEDEWSSFYQGGGDAQQLFTKWIQSEVYGSDSGDKYNFDTGLYNAIQGFIPEFSKEVLDIMKYPFDKEKGYTVIKEGRLEVFVYQLEKMNEIIEPFSDFIGKPVEQWIRSNEASEKWIADSYKQAQQELKFPQEYFDKCYNEPYVKHFYSEADIEKFKNKWRKNIL